MQNIATELAPTGVLRVGVNLGNFLLVTGKQTNGDPQGVSPDMGKAIAERLGLDLRYIPYASPAEVADAVVSGDWDIANIGAEPERAKTITFTTAYCEIEANYLVPAGSPIHSIDEVDRPGNRIAVYGRAAYGLWLRDHIQNAELVEADGMDSAVDAFLDQGLEVLAGLRARMVDDVERIPGSRILDGQFTAVQQAIGTHPDRPQAAEFLQSFVNQAVNSGFVAELIERHGVSGRLSVARSAD
jgi:polar amino acid transport system substrate-binding protein